MNDEPKGVKTGIVYQNRHTPARGFFHFSGFGASLAAPYSGMSDCRTDR